MPLCVQPLSPSPIGTGLILRNCPADGGPAQPLQPGDLNPVDLIRRTARQAREAVAPAVSFVEQVIRRPLVPIVAGAAAGAVATSVAGGVALLAATAVPAAAAAGFLARRAIAGAAIGTAVGAATVAGALAVKALQK